MKKHIDMNLRVILVTGEELYFAEEDGWVVEEDHGRLAIETNNGLVRIPEGKWLYTNITRR